MMRERGLNMATIELDRLPEELQRLIQEQAETEIEVRRAGQPLGTLRFSGAMSDEERMHHLAAALLGVEPNFHPDPPVFTPVELKNQAAGRRINDAARRDPSAPYAGKCIAIADGEVFAVADNFRALMDQVRRSKKDLQTIMCMEVGLDYDTPDEIWNF